MELRVEKNSFIFNFNYVPKGFLVCALLAGIFETFLFVLPEHKLSEAPYERAALEMKESAAAQSNSYALIALGDCTGWAAIRPITLERELNSTAFNFAVNGVQTYLVSYILLKRYLSHCLRKPTLVVLQVSANTLLGDFAVDKFALHYYILPYFRIDFDFLAELSPRLQLVCIKHALLTLLPSLKNQYLLRKDRWFFRLWKPTRDDYEHYREFYQRERGFYNEDMDPRKRELKIKEIKDIDSNYKTFRLSEFNLFYIEKIISLLSQHQVKVVVCTESVRDDEMAIWNRYNLRERLNEALCKRLKAYDNVVAFLDLRDSASHPDYYVDRVHLNSKGAEIHTRALAQKIKQLNILSGML